MHDRDERRARRRLVHEQTGMRGGQGGGLLVVKRVRVGLHKHTPGGKKTAKPTRKSLRPISMASKNQNSGLYGACRNDSARVAGVSRSSRRLRRCRKRREKNRMGNPTA